MSEYKKITKEDIDFPKYCLFFIKRIQEEIDKEIEKDEENNGYYKFIQVEIDTTLPYCSDAFDLIIKTFEKKGITTWTPTYKLETIDNVRHYLYNWRLRMSDGLPF